jgi:hypothetical protein
VPSRHLRVIDLTSSITGTATAAALQADSPALVAAEVKPPEASTSSSDASASDERAENDERSRIVETMDADACVVRQRRLAFYNRDGDDFSENSTSTSYTTNPTIMEHNYAEASAPDVVHNLNPNAQDKETARDGTGITIKLKYINDDLKLVDGKLQEQLGDFKK